jgi:hypothetical protein
VLVFLSFCLRTELLSSVFLLSFSVVSEIFLCSPQNFTISKFRVCEVCTSVFYVAPTTIYSMSWLWRTYHC